MAKLLLPLLHILCAALAGAQVSPHGPINLDCQTCHATDSWEMKKDAGFDHATAGFPLTGRHRTLDCASCHEGLKFTSKSSDCLTCHTDVHKSELGVNCTRCHSTQTWRIADMIQRHQQTRFPLVGRHVTVECQSCHANASTHQYVGTPTTCVGCHKNDYEATKNPSHPTAGFSTECAKCHRVTAFTWGQGFDHDLTAFPLGGAHKTVACIACHQNGKFQRDPNRVQCLSSWGIHVHNQPQSRGGGIRIAVSNLSHACCLGECKIRSHSLDPIPTHGSPYVVAMLKLSWE